MSMQIYRKTPQEVLDYGEDWSDWLGSDIIQSSTWQVDAGLTVGATENDNTTTKIWLSGGAVGGRYYVVNRIVTAGGRTAERSFQVRITEHRYS